MGRRPERRWWLEAGALHLGYSSQILGDKGGKEEFTSPYSHLFSLAKAFITRVIKKSEVSIIGGCRLYNFEFQRHQMVLLSNTQHEQ